jgi:transcriptional regulator with XRE-family HTH domain
MTWVNLGAVLNKANNGKGISMKKFAEMMKMQPSDVSRLFRGKRDIKISTLIAWSEALNVPLKNFFDDDLSAKEMTMPRPSTGESMFQAMKKTGAIKRLKEMNKKRLKKKK